jgi:hypothetical protein
MIWTLKTETKDINNGCRNAIKDRPDSLYACVYNADGYGVANLDRLGRIGGDGKVYLHDHIAGNDEPNLHATTDEDWQSITRCIRASPEMLQTLRTVQQKLDIGEGISAAEAGDFSKLIKRVIDKADPPKNQPQHVTRTVTVMVEVDVEVETIEGLDALPENVSAAAIAAVRAGEGQIVEKEILPPIVPAWARKATGVAS